MLTFILEAAMRSLLMALAVWGAIRLLRVQTVLAQKVAWVMVLLAAGVMPLVMHSRWMRLSHALHIQLPTGPVEKISRAKALFARWQRVGDSAVLPAGLTGHTAENDISVLNVHAPIWHAMAGGERIGATKAGARAPRREGILSGTSGAGIALQNFVADAAFASNTLSLPVGLTGVEVELPYAAARQAKFWTASRLRTAVICFYFGIVGVLLLRTMLGLAVTLRILARAKQVNGFTDDAGRAMRVRVSGDLTTPITIGSTVILPADYVEWDAEMLRVVLAHEQSHVRQGDFYLQLLAAVHSAIFWFSPLGWWLKYKLSDLGEAISDRAALEHAEDAASYARVLLELAATPRRVPLAGVAMARTSNLSSRIERILNDRRFRLAFLGGRRHAVIAAALVPAAFIVAVAGFQIGPTVYAACSETQAKAGAHETIKSFSRSSTAICTQGSSTATVRTLTSAAPQLDAAVTAATVSYTAQDAAPSATSAAEPAAGQAVPAPPASGVAAPEAPEPPPAPEDSDTPAENTNRHTHAHTVIHDGDGGESFSIVHENGDGTLSWNGEYSHDLEKARKKMNVKGDYILFERDGKPYVITDPAIVAQADAMFREDPALERQQKVLAEQQKVLEKQMSELDTSKMKINVDTPEFRKQMADLNVQIAVLQSDEFKKHMEVLNKQVNQEVLSKLQEQMGNIQEQIGQIQGQIGEEMGKFGEKQGKLGEKMGALGEQMGRIGEEQGRHAEEATRKMQSVLDRALRDGKAKPVD